MVLGSVFNCGTAEWCVCVKCCHSQWCVHVDLCWMFFSFALLRTRMKTEPVKARKRNWKKKLPQDTRIPAAGSEYLLCPALRSGCPWREWCSSSPFLLSPTPSFPQIIGKTSFFLTLQTNLLQSFYKQLVEMNFHPQNHWLRTIVLLNKVSWPLLWREYFLPGFLWYTVGLGFGLEIKICAFNLTPSGNSLFSMF